jgi:hypothetical protein
LPVYHVEKFFVNEQVIFETTKDILADRCPYTSSSEIRDDLIKLLFSDEHLKSFTKALLDAKVAGVAKAAWDIVYARGTHDSLNLQTPQFYAVETEAKRLLEESIKDSTWRAFCKGRALIRAYCAKNQLRYEHFRNLLVNRMTEPPDELKAIMDKILQT